MSIFGQNPADITGAIFKSKNFSDVPDKAAARNNLDVPSKAEVLYNSVPVGMILPYWGSVAPAGYLPCSGQTVTSGTFPELVTFLGGGASQVVPDLRGEFLRGWDNGRGLDTGRAISTVQTDALQNITGSYGSLNTTAIGQNFTGVYSGTGSIAYPVGTGATVAGSTALSFDASRVARTAAETRPHNVSVLYCIKAYSSVANYTSSVNIAGLISDYSTLNAAAVKYADLNGANQNQSTIGYQKFPGGLIMQWGNGACGPTPGTPITVTYPTAFTTRTCSISVTRTATSIGTDFNTFATDSSASTTGFPIRSQIGSITFYWIAIGY